MEDAKGLYLYRRKKGDKSARSLAQRHTEAAIGVIVSINADRERAILTALKAKNLALARKIVNGGTHGLDRFSSAYNAILGVIRND